MSLTFSLARLPAINAALAGLCLTWLPISSVSAKTEPLVGSNYGPPPDWTRYRELGEAALRNILIDPDSARIEWPNGYVQRGYTPTFRHRIYGYSTCGLVNSRNRMGGYAGKAYFGVVIDHDQVLYAEVGEADGSDFLSRACAKASFPAAAEMLAAKPAMAADQLGFTLTDTPQGAFVVSVERGGAADRAGLHANATVTQLNGSVLKGMSEEKINDLVATATGPLALTLDTGDVVTITPAGSAPAPASVGRP